MYSFFPVFAYNLQSLYPSESIRIGHLSSLADADLSNNGLCISVYKNEETKTIQDQGYESQYRLKVDFDYSIAIISNVSEAAANEVATTVLGLIRPGIDVIVAAYDGSAYSMYISKINDKVEYNSDIAAWVQTLNFVGSTFLKEI